MAQTTRPNLRTHRVTAAIRDASGSLHAKQIRGRNQPHDEYAIRGQMAYRTRNKLLRPARAHARCGQLCRPFTQKGKCPPVDCFYRSNARQRRATKRMTLKSEERT